MRERAIHAVLIVIRDAKNRRAVRTGRTVAIPVVAIAVAVREQAIYAVLTQLRLSIQSLEL